MRFGERESSWPGPERTLFASLRALIIMAITPSPFQFNPIYYLQTARTSHDRKVGRCWVNQRTYAPGKMMNRRTRNFFLDAVI